MTTFHFGAYLYGMPGLYFLGTLAAIGRPAPKRMWAIAETIASVVAMTAIAGLLVTLLTRPSPAIQDAPGLTMAMLVAVLGWIIVRFSSRYLAGEPAQNRYAASLLFTLAAVMCVVLTHHLLVLVVAWLGTSLGLHRLLTYYGDRPAALTAAHKKFLASRLAELCLCGALWLLWHTTGTLSLDGIMAKVPHFERLPLSMQAATLLIALAVILKSAQLPVHGWLIQVMEAPTPVSALLHAGIVNLGGFVLIRIATLLSEVPAAQALLVLAGGTTAVLASLVMMTRISIKVRLAWSTCAQMGFMLLECGLGLYDLALLHLVAHSLYKAHAFLTTGETVIKARRRHLWPDNLSRVTGAIVLTRLFAPAITIGIVFFTSSAWHALLAIPALPAVAVVIIGLGLAPLLWPTGSRHGSTLLRGSAAAIALSHLYLLWHQIFGIVVAPQESSASVLLVAWALTCMAALYAMQCWLWMHPASVISRHLYRWAYYGFYLDERFTRLVFRVWPPRLRGPGPAAPSPAPISINPGEYA